MHLLKILASWTAKYCHLNLGKLVFQKKLMVRAEVRYPSKDVQKHERNACSKGKKTVTIIFHNKAKLTHLRYVVTILK